MPNSDNWFQQLRESLRNVGNAFDDVKGARLIPLYSSTTEEEYIPDPEQLDEYRRLAADLKNTWVREAESDLSDHFTRSFREAPCRFNPTYFVDGSVRSVRALDGVEGNFVFPVVIGQIGAASVRRNARNEPVKFGLETKIVLLIPLSQLSDTLRIGLTSRVQGTRLEGEIYDPLVSQDGSPTGPTGTQRDYVELRSRAARRVKYSMANLEKQVLESCATQLSDETQLIVLDGPLIGMLKEAKMPENKIQRVVGVSKSFSMKPLILIEEYLGRSDCISKVLNLKDGERTDAIELHIDPCWVVTWYQRIHPRNRVESPLDGIVKVETHFPDYRACNTRDEQRAFEQDWSTTWDEIANTIYSERFPIPFHEQRWHSLLYPIYCCERLLKSSFLSPEVLRGLCSQFET